MNRTIKWTTTQYDLVPPYPAFVPKISLKREGCVVINTGNFLHSVTVDLETLGTNQVQKDAGLFIVPSILKAFPSPIWKSFPES